ANVGHANEAALEAHDGFLSGERNRAEGEGMEGCRASTDVDHVKRFQASHPAPASTIVPVSASTRYRAGIARQNNEMAAATTVADSGTSSSMGIRRQRSRHSAAHRRSKGDCTRKDRRGLMMLSTARAGGVRHPMPFSTCFA